MSWVSTSKLTTIMNAIRNKFVTSDLVITDSTKTNGVELNYAAQDGLVTVSPLSESSAVESALHLSNGDDTKKTELTQGTLSYVTGSGDSETYNYMSLLGEAVTFGKNGGGNVQIGGVADPTSEQQVATKAYVDGKLIKVFTASSSYTFAVTYKAGITTIVNAAELMAGHTINEVFSAEAYVEDSDAVLPLFTCFHRTSKGKYLFTIDAVLSSSASDVTMPAGTRFITKILYN